jgi:WD40 repeat protein
LLATCGRDKTVWIWELQPGNDFECVAVLNGHTQDVKCVKWHPTEDVLVSCGYDDTVATWEEDEGGDDWSHASSIGVKEGGHESTVWAVAFEPGGRRRMVSCSDDRTIKVWNAEGEPSPRDPPRGSLSLSDFFPKSRSPRSRSRALWCWSDGRVGRAPDAPGST